MTMRMRRAQLGLLPFGGVLLQIGCLGRLEDGLSLLAAPTALANAERLPNSVLLPIAELLLRVWF